MAREREVIVPSPHGIIVLLTEGLDDLDELYIDEHLPGKHDQSTHGHGKGGTPKAPKAVSAPKAPPAPKAAAKTTKAKSAPVPPPPPKEEPKPEVPPPPPADTRRYGSPEDTAKSSLMNVSEEQLQAALKPSMTQWIKKDMTPQEKAAVQAYTGHMYTQLNGALRKGPPIDPSLQATIDQATAGLNKYSLPDAMTLYRGMGDTSGKHWNFYQSMVGQTYTDPAFGSTSRASSVAQDFIGGSKTGILFQIHAPAGTNGGFVASFSHFPQEKEFVLPPGTSYKVLSASIINGQRTVQLGVAAPSVP